MSHNISLFPTYSQTENRTTNYCLLILKMLYEENPKFLSEIFSSLLGENFSGMMGVQFTQQRRTGISVPDGEIFQDPFSIFVETKLGENFREEQLLNHLDTLKNRQGQRLLLALGNFDIDPKCDPVLQRVEAKAKSENVAFAVVSFEHFLRAIRLPSLPKNLDDAVLDLGEYFDKNCLLPSWKYRLDVVNCKMSFEIVSNLNLYTCPARGGQYNHRRSLYFGMYRNKCVKKIAKIEAVIDLESKEEQTLLWNNDDTRSAESLIQIALERRQQTGDYWYPVRVFVLGDLYSTNFKKTSPGGMLGSKQYFNISKLQVNDAQHLANELGEKTWDNY